GMSRTRARSRRSTDSRVLIYVSSSHDRERPRQFTGGGGQLVDRRDRRPGRPIAQGGAELGDRLLAAFGRHLDRAVGPVAHPSGEAQPARCLARKPSEPHALHPAANRDVDAHHPLSPVPHPWCPTSGTKRKGATSCSSIAPFFRSATTSFCSSRSPIGMSSRPPSASWSSSGCGIEGAPALTRIASYGAYSRQPMLPSPRRSDTLLTPVRWMFSRACCISAGMRSIENTCATRWANRTVW